MASTGPGQQPFTRNFQIITPTETGSGSPYTPDPSDNTLEVRVSGPDGDSYTATFSDVAGGVTTSISGSVLIPLNPVPGNPGLFSARLNVGTVPTTVPATPNKLVHVDDLQGAGTIVVASQDEPFIAWLGSGSSGGIQLARRGGGIHGAKQPVPAAVQLRPSGTADDRTDGLATLIYCDVPGEGGCWLSAPIDLGRPDADPGFWQLRKSDPRTWSLQLRQGGAELVAYRLTTADEHDYALPIRLEVAGADGESYPPAVLVAAAP